MSTLHMADQHRRPASPEGIVIGLMIMLFGVVLFLARMGVVEWRGEWGAWHVVPFLLLGIGLTKLLKPRRNGHRRGGFLVILGGWLLLNQLSLLRFRDSWPLILVALGIGMAWNALAGSPPLCCGGPRRRVKSEVGEPRSPLDAE